MLSDMLPEALFWFLAIIAPAVGMGVIALKWDEDQS